MNQVKITFHTGFSDIDVDLPEDAVHVDSSGRQIRLDCGKLPNNLAEPLALMIQRTSGVMPQRDRVRARGFLEQIADVCLAQLKVNILRRFDDDWKQQHPDG